MANVVGTFAFLFLSFSMVTLATGVPVSILKLGTLVKVQFCGLFCASPKRYIVEDIGIKKIDKITYKKMAYVYKELHS